MPHITVYFKCLPIHEYRHLINISCPNKVPGQASVYCPLVSPVTECLKKLQPHVTPPKKWNVCGTNCDVVTWFIDCSLCWLWIFSSKVSSRGSSGSETLGFATVLWDPLQTRTENHLSFIHFHSEWWESRPCCTLVLRDTQTPWGAGIKALWWRVWNAPWQTGKTCWMNEVSKSQRLLCSKAHAVC